MRVPQDYSPYCRLMFTENKAVMLLIDPDDGTIIEASRGASEYYGHSQSDLTAMSIFDINTMSKAEIVAEMQQAKKESKNHFNFRHRLSSGEVRDVEVYSNPIPMEGHWFLCSIIHDVTKRKQMEDERDNIVKSLQIALNEIRTLKGVIPICSYCRNIRDNDGVWSRIETYLSKNSDAKFSHGICPECLINIRSENNLD